MRLLHLALLFQPKHGDLHSTDNLQAWKWRSHLRTTEKLRPMKLYQSPFYSGWFIFREAKIPVLKQFESNSTANWYSCLKLSLIKKKIQQVFMESPHCSPTNIQSIWSPLTYYFSSRKISPKTISLTKIHNPYVSLIE